MPVLALEFDTSIDDDIRKNYNPSRLNDEASLPALPKILKTTNPTVNSKSTKVTQISKDLKIVAQPVISKTNLTEGYYAIIKHGKKFKVRSLNNISDTFKRGTRVTFVSKYPVSSTYFTIPAGTIFKGEIISIHKPQFTGNGGLIVIRIDSVIINNEIQPINGFISKANSKKIFFNNIKGKRKYISSMLNSTKPGFHFFRKMLKVTANLATDGSSIVVSPFSLLVGCVAVAGNVIVSPVIAVFHKGNSIQIPAGSDFEIKLNEDVFIYN